ncbi:MAG: hypothetical protein OEW09_10930 [Anaerolineae bacterium]|nr:hypothetical protein [Anaerolineae bacterium]
MKTARIILGILYLAGAVANIALTVINSPASYNSFADEALVAFYREAWARVAIPNMTLFIPLLIAFEITLGGFFLIGGRFLKIALVGGILFCLGTVPFGLKMMSTNLPLGLIQAFMLWKELRQGNDMKSTQENL